MVQKLLESKQKTAINAIPLCLGKVSKEFTADNIKKTGFYGYVYDFSVDYDAIAVDDILDIRKYLMQGKKWHSINKMFRFIKQIFFTVFYTFF